MNTLLCPHCRNPFKPEPHNAWHQRYCTRRACQRARNRASYRARLIEHWGSGTTRIVGACRAASLKAEFQVEGGCFIVCLRKLRRSESGSESGSESHVRARILQGLLGGPKSRSELASVLGHRSVTGAARKSVTALLAQGLIEHTIPDRPQSRLQKYRLTEKGRAAASGAK